MFTTLLSVVVVLVLGHLAHGLSSALRDHGWFHGWLRWLDGKCAPDSFWRGPWGIALALLPVLLVLALFQLALDGVLFGLPSLLLAILVLFHSWGPRDLDEDVAAIVDAPSALQRREAAARLHPAAGLQVAAIDGPALVEVVFRSALRRWFGVLFWFVLLGPFGALLYRLTAVAAEDAVADQLPAGTVSGARTLLAVLDWPAAQLLTFSLALVGNFDAVIAAWKQAGGATLALGLGFLDAAARACVRSEIADEAEEYAESGILLGSALVLELGPLPELRDAMSLVWRVLLVWLATIAIFIIAGWVS
mgnify:CR=1 FL=1